MNAADIIQIALVMATAGTVVMGVIVFIWDRFSSRKAERYSLLITARRTFEKNLIDYQNDSGLAKMTDLYEIIITLEEYISFPTAPKADRLIVKKILNMLPQFRKIQILKPWGTLTKEEQKLIWELLQLFASLPQRSHSDAPPNQYLTQTFNDLFKKEIKPEVKKKRASKRGPHDTGVNKR